MAVEILFLSGPRQGERHRRDSHRIVVGDVANADVALHSGDPPAARGRHATLDCSEQGWTLTNRGAGDWLVNQTPVSSAQSTRLRSGDVVRFSDEGPDFRFSIVAARDESASHVPAPVEAVAAERQGAADSTPDTDEDMGRLRPRRANAGMFGAAGLLAIVALSAYALIRFANSDAPPRAVDDTVSVEVGKSVRIAVLQNDQDEDPERLTIGQLDTSSTAGTAAINADGTVAYDATGKFDQLQRGQSGADGFRYTIRDAAGHESQAAVHIQVLRPANYNRPPRAADDTAQVTVGGETALSVLSNDSDPDGDSLKVVRLVLEGAKGSATVGNGGVILYRAAAGAEQSGPGGAASDSFGYVLADGHGGEATAHVTITVTGVGGQGGKKEAAGKLADGVVYLIVELKGRKVPICSGWAARPDLVVSTALHVSLLEQALDKGNPVFVGYGGTEPHFIPVDEVSVHPLFDKKSPESPVSRAHNVGLVMLKVPLPVHFDVARSVNLPTPLTGMKVSVLAYRLAVEPEFQPLNILDPPLLVTARGCVRGMEVATDSTNDLPLLLLDAAPPPGGAGAAVVDEQGRAIGVLAGPSGNHYVVLADQVDPLLPEDGRTEAKETRPGP